SGCVDVAHLARLSLLAAHAHINGSASIRLFEKGVGGLVRGIRIVPAGLVALARSDLQVVAIKPPRSDDHGVLVEERLGDRGRCLARARLLARFYAQAGLFGGKAELPVGLVARAALARAEVDVERLAIRSDDLLAVERRGIRCELHGDPWL